MRHSREADAERTMRRWEFGGRHVSSPVEGSRGSRRRARSIASSKFGPPSTSGVPSCATLIPPRLSSAFAESPPPEGIAEEGVAHLGRGVQRSLFVHVRHVDVRYVKKNSARYMCVRVRSKEVQEALFGDSVPACCILASPPRPLCLSLAVSLSLSRPSLSVGVGGAALPDGHDTEVGDAAVGPLDRAQPGAHVDDGRRPEALRRRAVLARLQP